MSLFGLFDSGKSALFASQRGLATTSHNIANMNTPGYTRQKVILETASPIILGGNLVGRGVSVGGIERQYNKFIQLQLIGQYQTYGKSYALEQQLSQVEQVFNEVTGFGLSTQLDAFFNAWQNISNDPEGISQRTVLLQETDALIQKAVKMQDRLTSQLSYINDNISDLAGEVNSIATNIATLNVNIVKVEGVTGSQQANDLRDERDQLLNELSNLIEFNSYENANGISVIAGGHTLVGPDGANSITITANAEGNNEIYLTGTNITSRITKGQIGGLLEVRTDIESTSLNSLRKLVAAVANEVNMIHGQGFGLDTQISDFTITDITAEQLGLPLPNGSVNSAAITDFSTFVPGNYQIDLVGAGPATYDVYKDGTLLSSGNTYTASTIVVNGLTITLDGAEAAGDSFYITAQGNNFFNAPSVYTAELDASAAAVTSATVFNRASLTYDEYEIRFTTGGDNAAYEVYNLDTGVNVTTGIYASGTSIRFDGLEVEITGTVADGATAPAAGDVFLISPIRNAITDFSAAITDTNKIAASSTSTGIPGNNINALDLANLAQTQHSELSNATLTGYYSQIVSNIGSQSKAAIDTLRFDENLRSELEFTRESISGVSLDEEAANLMKFQRAYEAAARIIRITDELLETLINL